MFVVVWQFEIAEEKVAAFEAAYGPEGAWAQLFALGKGYRGTELLVKQSAPLRYVTIARWKSAEHFARFCEKYAAEYSALDKKCGEWTESETPLGAWAVM